MWKKLNKFINFMKCWRIVICLQKELEIQTQSKSLQKNEKKIAKREIQTHKRL